MTMRESQPQYFCNGVRRRRTVSECGGGSYHTQSHPPLDVSHPTQITNNHIPPHAPKQKNFIIILSIVAAVLGTSALLFLIWSGDATSRKQVFLPQVEQLATSVDSENIFELDVNGECEGQNALGLELEAASAVHAALEMKEQGKLGKAKKLFHHAMVLCPRHADILTHYGEFFEDSRDYLMADHLYVQALTYAPHHTKAMTNRQRTSPVVEEMDERRLQKIDEKLEMLISIPDTNSALRRVKKEAYFQHLYHTAGIEGNTMSLAQTRLIVETRMAVGGKSLMEHNEILGLDDAMKFINSSLIQRIGAITTQDILDIHFHVMSYVDPSEAGKFRRTQVYVGSHVPPPPTDIVVQMDNLIEWLNSDDALSLHPIHYAAIAHYKLVHIHPFVDGNGRTSRLLMNFILMQAGYPPVIIRKQDRQLYYDHLNAANNGDVRPFIRFIADCTEKTIDVYLWASTELGKYHILGPQETETSDTISD